ncbi:MAG: hypothetical protein R3E08_01570 [Thiotrichaceae bacterium]
MLSLNHVALAIAVFTLGRHDARLGVVDNGDCWEYIYHYIRRCYRHDSGIASGIL